MSRRILVLAALAAAAACADNRTSVEILGRAAPDGIPSCKFAAGGEQLAGPGQLDVSVLATSTYDAMLYVNNTVVDPSKTNTSTVPAAKAWRALAAKIRLNPSDYLQKFPPSPDLLGVSGEARLPLDGTTIDPGTNGVVHASIIGLAMGGTLSAAVLANSSGTAVVGVTLEGETLDGTTVDSGEWYFALKACKGTGCAYPTCKTGDVLAGCFPGAQDPLACVTP